MLEVWVRLGSELGVILEVFGVWFESDEGEGNSDFSEELGRVPSGSGSARKKMMIWAIPLGGPSDVWVLAF